MNNTAPSRDPREPKALPRWLVIAASTLPVVVMLAYFYLKPAPERVVRVRPPGPTVPLYKANP